jgi:hypothetical protein
MTNISDFINELNKKPWLKREKLLGELCNSDIYFRGVVRTELEGFDLLTEELIEFSYVSYSDVRRWASCKILINMKLGKFISTKTLTTLLNHHDYDVVINAYYILVDRFEKLSIEEIMNSFSEYKPEIQKILLEIVSKKIKSSL